MSNVINTVLEEEKNVDKKSEKYNTKKIKILYSVALLFIALSMILSYVIMTFALSGNSDDSTVINYSGRQRMLSQKITKCVLAISIAPDRENVNKVTKELTTALSDWTRAHNGLQFGDAEKGIEKKELSKAIGGLFLDILPSHEIMVSNISELLKIADDPNIEMATVNGFAKKIAPTILTNEKIFLPLMDKITFTFNQESLGKIKVLEKIEIGILIMGLTLLVVEFIIVFTPTLRRVNNTLQELVVINNQLFESKKNITESIHYAQNIQIALIPPVNVFKACSKDNFVIWKPKDIVGGDIYWAKEVKNGYVVALIDCTGHGVPGALMTMTAISSLGNIVNNSADIEPGKILNQMNRAVRSTLGKQGKKVTHELSSRMESDDGMEVGLCYVIPSENRIVYCGSRLVFFRCHNGEVTEVRGDKQAIGYFDSDENFQYQIHELEAKDGEQFYISSDGYVDQNGGVKNRSFGKKKFSKIITDVHKLPMEKQKVKFEEALDEYMNGQNQRDDITVIGLKMYDSAELKPSENLKKKIAINK